MWMKEENKVYLTPHMNVIIPSIFDINMIITDLILGTTINSL